VEETIDASTSANDSPRSSSRLDPGRTAARRSPDEELRPKLGVEQLSQSVDDLSLLEPINRVLAEDARETPSPEHAIAIAQLQTLSRRIVAFWDEADVVLTPTLAMRPVPIGWTYEDTDGDARLAFARQTLFTPFTPLVNVTGQPAMSLPLHWSADDLPVGVQLIGRPFAEATLLRLAAQLEQARPWAHRRPPVS